MEMQMTFQLQDMCQYQTDEMDIDRFQLTTAA